MINRVVYSYWNPDGYSNTSGYKKFEDFLASISLSVQFSKKHFKEVVLVTNSFGKEVLIDKLGLQFDDVNLEFDKWSHVNRIWWGWFKVLAYSLQNKPFIHIDNDAYFINKPREEILTSKLCFQSIETPFADGYGWYVPLLKKAATLPYFPQIIKENPVGYAYNCGITGGSNLDIIKEWYEVSSSFVHSQVNKSHLEGNELSIHQNLLHEQYFIASLTKSKGWLPNKDIKFLLNTDTLMQDCYKPNEKFTHFWGLTKKEEKNVKKIEERLKKDFLRQFENLKNFKS